MSGPPGCNRSRREGRPSRREAPAPSFRTGEARSRRSAGPRRPDEPVQARLGERGVEHDPGLHDRGAIGATPIQREEERDAVYERRRDDRRQYATFVMRLPYQADVSETEVPQSAVDQLRGRARRCAAEVAGVHERDRETGARCVGRYPGADIPPPTTSRSKRRSASSVSARSRIKPGVGSPTLSSRQHPWPRCERAARTEGCPGGHGARARRGRTRALGRRTGSRGGRH
jgi:hypothetical protein